MPTYRQVIARAGGASGLLLDAVIKDHILGYLLAAIAATPGLGERLAFKGGTALRKCWFPAYRYSEDLDFTLIGGSAFAAGELPRLIESASREAIRLVPDYGARYSFESRVLSVRAPHPFGQTTVRLIGTAPTRAPVTIKVEVTGTDEPLLLPVTVRSVLHAFPDEQLDARVRCYALEEIAAEKVRAGLQVRDRLDRFAAQGRAGYAHRVRDIYDLWYLRTSNEAQVDWTTVRRILPAKAHARNTQWESTKDFRDPRMERLYRDQWVGRLTGFVGQLPSFDTAWAVYAQLLEEIVAIPMPPST